MFESGTECVYNPKQKPGLKPGAVEALTRRVGMVSVRASRRLDLTHGSISREYLARR
jgi:hypothetical protein